MRTVFSLLLVILLASSLSAQDKSKDKVTYDDHVKPIFRDHCFSCHNQNKKEGDLDLTNYTSLMQGGGSGAVIEPGSPSDSYLFALVNHDDEPSMPPEQPKIPDAKLATISKWIELGALENVASKAMIKKKKKFDFALTDPAVGKPSVMPLPGRLDIEPVIHTKRATGVTALATSPWAPLVAIGGQKQVLLYDTRTRELKGVFPFPEGVISVLKFSRNGSLLLAGGGRGGARGLVVVWNIRNGERIIEVGDELDTVLAADISSDQKLVAMGGPQKLVRVYSTADNSLVYELKKHTDWVTSLEFSPDGVLLATGDRNGGVFVWEAFSGREYLTLKGHRAAITGTTWRSDSNIVVTASEDATIRMWELNNGGQIRSWTSHGGGAQGVEFTRDGKIVSCGRDRYAKLWDQAGKQLVAFPPFPDMVMSVTYCDETGTCIAGDWTGEIRQFNAKDGKLLGTLSSNPSPLAVQLADVQKLLAGQTAQATNLAKVASGQKTALDQLVASITSNKQKIAQLTGALAKLTPKIAADEKQMAALNGQLKAVTDRATILKTAVPEITKAKTSADAAVAKLPADAELKKLAADINGLLGKKQTELTQKQTEMATLAKQVADLAKVIAADKANAQKYTTELNAAKQALAKLEPTLKPAQDQYAKSKAAADAAAAQAAATKKRAAELAAAIEFSRKYRELVERIRTEDSELEKLAIQHAELVAQMNEARKNMESRKADFDGAQKKVDAKTAEIAGIRQKIQQLTGMTQALKTAMANIRQSIDRTQKSIAAIQAAKTQLDMAIKVAPNDADVAAAQKSLVDLINKQNQKIAAAQAELKAKTGLMAKATADLNAESQKLAASEKSMTELKVLLDASRKEYERMQKMFSEASTKASTADASVKAKEQVITDLRKQKESLQGI